MPKLVLATGRSRSACVGQEARDSPTEAFHQGARQEGVGCATPLSRSRYGGERQTRSEVLDECIRL